MLSAPPGPRRARVGSAFGLVALIATTLSGGACQAPSPSTAASTPVRVVIGLAQPGPLPTSTPVGVNMIVSHLANERLVTLGRDGRPEPALAERWERSADGLTWRFFLRPHLTFHDGTPLDAYRLAESLAPRVGAGLGGGGLAEGTTVSADNETTLVFRLRQPSSLLIEDVSVLNITSTGDKAAPSGPFDVVSTRPDQVHLRAFSHYFRGKPKVDEVDVVVYPNGRNAWSAMMRGEVDFLYDVTPEAVDFIEQSSRAEVKTFLRPYVYTLGMNMRHPVLRNREVRLALNVAVNRTQIIERVFRGRGYPASSHVWPKHWAYDHLLPRFRFLPAEAARRLDAAGLALKTTKAGQPKARFSFICLVPDADQRYERIALLLQQQLIDVGVDMQLQSISLRDLLPRLAKGDYDAVLMDVVSTPGLNYIYNLWHSPGKAPVYFFDSGYTAADAVLDRLQLAATDEETRSAVHDLQMVMHEDPPAVFLCWGETSRAVSGRFRLPPVTDRDILKTLPEWVLASTPVDSTR